MEILLSTVINFFKIATFVVYIYCIVAYNLWDSYAAWLLLATHGTYGLLWTSKTWFGYSDKNFEVKAPLYYLFATAIVLTLYWLPMAMIVQYRPVLQPPVAALVVALFGWGVYFHFAADLHKTVFIQQRGVLQNIEQTLKQGNNKDMNNIFPKVTFLRSNLFAISRNPNYFGELLIYLSFALCSMHIYPLIYLLVVIAVVWFPNMRKKDASLSRFGDEYANYSRNTAKLIPFVW